MFHDRIGSLARDPPPLANTHCTLFLQRLVELVGLQDVLLTSCHYCQL